MSNYSKQLDYIDLFLLSTGHILGAGIFVLVGKISKYSGYNSWISILIAGLMALWFGKSFINIAKKYPQNDTEYKVIEERFGTTISKMVTTGILIGNVMTCLVVALSFGGYLSEISPFSSQFSALLCVLISSFIAIIGIKETSIFTNITTIMETSGLYLIIILGIYQLVFQQSGISSIVGNIKNFKNLKNIKNLVNLINLKDVNITSIISGILLGAYIIIFAFFGFETVVRFIEESKNPDEDVPRAISNSIYFTTFTYILVSIISLSFIKPTIISNSKAPLFDVIKKMPLGSYLAPFLGITAVVSTLNTFLLTLAGNSRLFANFVKLDENNTSNNKELYSPIILKLSSLMSNIDSKYKTPVNSTIFFTIIILVLMIIKLDIIPATIVGNTGIISGLLGVKMADIL